MNWTSFGSGFAAGLVGGKLLKTIFNGITNAVQGVYRTIVDATRSLFNDSVRDGTFSMPTKIKEDVDEYKGNSKKLRDWFLKYAKTHRYRGIMIQGHLFYMHNYDPLNKHKLPFYDAKPLVLCFGVYLAGTGNLVQYGINLHMLPQQIRVKFLVDVFELFKQKYKGEMYSNKPRKINEFSWETLQTFVNKYHIDFAVRSYIVERMTDVIVFDYPDWGKAVALSGAYIGANERELIRMYKEFIVTKKR